ncbi:hypothetical protein CYMTET_52403, partial [Cymbomonas tetramitiformis]
AADVMRCCSVTGGERSPRAADVMRSCSVTGGAAVLMAKASVVLGWEAAGCCADVARGARVGGLQAAVLCGCCADVVSVVLEVGGLQSCSRAAVLMGRAAGCCAYGVTWCSRWENCRLLQGAEALMGLLQGAERAIEEKDGKLEALQTVLQALQGDLEAARGHQQQAAALQQQVEVLEGEAAGLRAVGEARSVEVQELEQRAAAMEGQLQAADLVRPRLEQCEGEMKTLEAARDEALVLLKRARDEALVLLKAAQLSLRELQEQQAAEADQAAEVRGELEKRLERLQKTGKQRRQETDDLQAQVTALGRERDNAGEAARKVQANLDSCTARLQQEEEASKASKEAAQASEKSAEAAQEACQRAEAELAEAQSQLADARRLAEERAAHLVSLEKDLTTGSQEALAKAQAQMAQREEDAKNLEAARDEALNLLKVARRETEEAEKKYDLVETRCMDMNSTHEAERKDGTERQAELEKRLERLQKAGKQRRQESEELQAQVVAVTKECGEAKSAARTLQDALDVCTAQLAKQEEARAASEAAAQASGKNTEAERVAAQEASQQAEAELAEARSQLAEVHGEAEERGARVAALERDLTAAYGELEELSAVANERDRARGALIELEAQLADHREQEVQLESQRELLAHAEVRREEAEYELVATAQQVTALETKLRDSQEELAAMELNLMERERELEEAIPATKLHHVMEAAEAKHSAAAQEASVVKQRLELLQEREAKHLQSMAEHDEKMEAAMEAQSRLQAQVGQLTEQLATKEAQESRVEATLEASFQERLAAIQKDHSEALSGGARELKQMQSELAAARSCSASLCSVGETVVRAEPTVAFGGGEEVTKAAGGGGGFQRRMQCAREFQQLEREGAEARCDYIVCAAHQRLFGTTHAMAWKVDRRLM